MMAQETRLNASNTTKTSLATGSAIGNHVDDFAADKHCQQGEKLHRFLGNAYIDYR